MFKKVILVAITVGFLFATVGAAMAFQKGNDRKGKYLFRKTCRACHKEGASAKALGPNSKTQAQWERVFKEHERLRCADQWTKISAADQKDMLSFLYDHAYDSPTPATCQ